MQIENLNPQQRKAVEHLDGPTMIVAGAGSGKTRVLTHRYVNILRTHSIGTQNILYVTFTNKAAKEMKERIQEDGVKLYRDTDWISTFHAFGARVLRDNLNAVFPALADRKSINILTQRDSERLIDTLIADHKIRVNVRAKAISNKISRAKDDCLNPEQFKESITNSFDYTDAQVAEIYPLYQSYLDKNGYCDFGDLLNRTIQLFDEAPEILEKYQNQLQYIQVDEYQDTNLSQHTLLMQLGAKYKNVCVVGDPDQTIYTWRGARMENLQDFENKMGETTVIILDQNYRSTQNILDFANYLISNNGSEENKNLWGDKGKGAKVQIKLCGDEPSYIAGIISNMVDEGKYSYGDFCVLFRTNRQSGEIETRFRMKQLPYWVRGIGFYQRREVRDAIAFLKVLIDSDDDIHLQRILDLSRNGIGKRSVEVLRTWAADNSTSLFGALQNAKDIAGVSSQAKGGIKKFLIAYEGAAEKAELEDSQFVDILDDLMTRYKFYDYLDQEDKRQQDRGDEASISSRKDNVMELLGIARKSETLEDFLNIATLDTETQTGEAEQRNQIALMTVHGAKGLEYPVVIVGGMCEGLFPLIYRGSDIDEGRQMLAEERRLAYVAFTRAQEQLFLTLKRDSDPSRFIYEGTGVSAGESLENDHFWLDLD